MPAEPERVSWWQTILAVFAATILTTIGCALVVFALGWVPLTGDGHGLLVVSGGAASVILVIVARGWSATERTPMP